MTSKLKGYNGMLIKTSGTTSAIYSFVIHLHIPVIVVIRIFNHHSLQYNFNGRADLVRFIKEIQAQGLYASLRIGPFIEGEWNYG